MFRDIVSTLSLSPSASSQLSYYWRRLKGEQLTRQLSVVMAVMLAGLQIATVIAPPDAANASGGNDVVTGGINPHTKQAVINEYTNNSNFRALLNKYGVRKVDLTNASVGTTKASNHNLLSFGRRPNPADVNKVTVTGSDYYIRPLYKAAIDGNAAVFNVLEGRRHGDNKYFAVIFDCGNLVLTDLTPSNETVEIVSTTSNIPSAPAPAPAPIVKTPTAQAPIPPELPQTNIPVYKPTPVVTSTPTPTPAGTPNIVDSKSGVLATLDGQQVNANNATAKAGETITYTLKTKNIGTAVQSKYIVKDKVMDVLEYADITDKGGAVLFDNELRWPMADIKADETQTNTFTVKIKDPIPSTPTASTDPQSYDLKIENIYRDVITTSLAAPTTAKQVEVASASLPQTGPGLGTAIVFLFAGLVGYFYFRNRQLVTEISMLRNDYQGYGGEQ